MCVCVCACVCVEGVSPVGHVQGVEEVSADEVSEEGLRLAARRSVSDDDRAAATFQGETGSQLRMSTLNFLRRFPNRRIRCRSNCDT